jgi:hypothetical protein
MKCETNIVSGHLSRFKAPSLWKFFSFPNPQLSLRQLPYGTSGQGLVCHMVKLRISAFEPLSHRCHNRVTVLKFFPTYGIYQFFSLPDRWQIRTVWWVWQHFPPQFCNHLCSSQTCGWASSCSSRTPSLGHYGPTQHICE